MEQQFKTMHECRIINAHKYLAKMRGKKSRVHFQWDIGTMKKKYNKKKLVRVANSATVNGAVCSGCVHL